MLGLMACNQCMPSGLGTIKAISFAPTARGPRSSMPPVRSMASSLFDFWTKIRLPAAASGQASAINGTVLIRLPSRSYSLRLCVTPLESVSATTINGDDGEGIGDDWGEAEVVGEADGAD